MDAIIEDLLKEAGLNQKQKKFCRINPTHNVRLLAPAGSGKTFSLLWRCKIIHEDYLINRDDYRSKGIQAPHFLLIAFTNSAKNELEQRLRDVPEFKGINASVRTLNAWGWEQNVGNKELICNRKGKQSVGIHDLLPVYKKYSLINSAMNSGRSKYNNAVTIIELIDAYKSLGFKHTMTIPQYKKHIKYLKDVGLFEKWNQYNDIYFHLIGFTIDQNNNRETILVSV